MNKNIPEYRCHLCQSPKVIPIDRYQLFHRVTSDCKPWKDSGCLLVCQQCDAVQKWINPLFLSEVEAIYDEYSEYYQAGGKEQVVFQEDNNKIQTRSSAILKAVKENATVSSKGKYLDIGCGNGNMIETFSSGFPEWDLYGFDLDERHKRHIESIKKFKRYYSNDIATVTGRYDLISMVHVIEHIPDPGCYLAGLRRLLHPNGMLVIEVPNIFENPFDLLIADHCTHFTENQMVALLEKTGFKVTYSSGHVISKELTVVATPLTGDVSKSAFKTDENVLDYICRSIEWLEQVLENVRAMCKKGEIGVFGAGIASAWLINELKGEIAFCVDEDKHKIGRNYCGIPIYSPAGISGKRVFVPMPFKVSEKIADRLSGSNGNYYVATPDMGESIDADRIEVKRKKDG